METKWVLLANHRKKSMKDEDKTNKYQSLLRSVAIKTKQPNLTKKINKKSLIHLKALLLKEIKNKEIEIIVNLKKTFHNLT